MSFTEEEKQPLLALKGVGPTVIMRFEEIGISSFAQPGQFNADEIADRVANVLRTACWKNSPQVKTAINAAIERAKLPL